MPLPEATITFNLPDLLGAVLLPGWTHVRVYTNVPSQTLVDNDTGEIRIGDGNVDVDDDGTGSFTTWVPGPSGNPTSWQTSVQVRYRLASNSGVEATRTFGPYTITASGTLAGLIQQQEIPPEYAGELVAQVEGLRDEAAASAATASAVSGADTADDLIVVLDANPASGFRVQQDARLTATYATGGEVRSKAKADGTDQTAVMQAELDALYDAGGGTLIVRSSPLGAVPIKVTNLTLKNDGAALATMPPIGIRGQGAHFSSRATDPQGGTIIEFTGTDTHGLLKTNAIGALTLEGITFTNNNTAVSTPLVYTTNTTLLVRGCSFVGAKTGTACDQDAIVLGGPNQTEGGSGWDDGFQGYGTVIRDNFFNHVRRAVYGQAFANSVIVRDNCVWREAGSTTAGAIEFNGKPTGVGVQDCAANVIEGNLIECNNYAYAIVLRNASGFHVAANGIWDAQAMFVAGIWLAESVKASTIIEGYTTSGKVAVLETTPVVGLENRIITRQQGESSKMGPTDFNDTNTPSTFDRVKFVGAGSGSRTTVQPLTAVSSESARLFEMKRSAAEVTDAGVDIFYWQQNGWYTARGANAGNRTFKNAAGTDQTTFTDNGRRWNCPPGGAMRIDSGPGGTLNLWGTQVNVLGPTGAGGSNVFIQNRTTTPATPTAGGLLYVEGGALKYIGSSGTVTTIAPA